LEIGFYSFFLLLPEGYFGVDRWEEVSPWCEQMFLEKEKGHFSPQLIDTFWEYMDLP
jgi:hypothetical protein